MRRRPWLKWVMIALAIAIADVIGSFVILSVCWQHVADFQEEDRQVEQCFAVLDEGDERQWDWPSLAAQRQLRQELLALPDTALPAILRAGERRRGTARDITRTVFCTWPRPAAAHATLATIIDRYGQPHHSLIEVFARQEIRQVVKDHRERAFYASWIVAHQPDRWDIDSLITALQTDNRGRSVWLHALRQVDPSSLVDRDRLRPILLELSGSADLDTACRAAAAMAHLFENPLSEGKVVTALQRGLQPGTRQHNVLVCLDAIGESDAPALALWPDLRRQMERATSPESFDGVVIMQSIQALQQAIENRELRQSAYGACFESVPWTTRDSNGHWSNGYWYFIRDFELDQIAAETGERPDRARAHAVFHDDLAALARRSMATATPEEIVPCTYNEPLQAYQLPTEQIANLIRTRQATMDSSFCRSLWRAYYHATPDILPLAEELMQTEGNEPSQSFTHDLCTGIFSAFSHHRLTDQWQDAAQIIGGEPWLNGISSYDRRLFSATIDAEELKALATSPDQWQRAGAVLLSSILEDRAQAEAILTMLSDDSAPLVRYLGFLLQRAMREAHADDEEIYDNLKQAVREVAAHAYQSTPLWLEAYNDDLLNAQHLFASTFWRHSDGKPAMPAWFNQQRLHKAEAAVIAKARSGQQWTEIYLQTFPDAQLPAEGWRHGLDRSLQAWREADVDDRRRRWQDLRRWIAMAPRVERNEGDGAAIWRPILPAMQEALVERLEEADIADWDRWLPRTIGPLLVAQRQTSEDLLARLWWQALACRRLPADHPLQEEHRRQVMELEACPGLPQMRRWMGIERFPPVLRVFFR